MYNTELMQEILKSKAAWDIIDELSPIYGDARVALWLFQVIGAELDLTRLWTQETMDQVVPHTATWSLDHWEDELALPRDPTLNTEGRRQRILTHLRARAPMNPYKLAQVASTAAGGAECRVEERTGAGSVFTIWFNAIPNDIDLKKVKVAVERAKQARLSYKVKYELYNHGTAFVGGALAGITSCITALLPGKFEPKPVRVTAYAAAALNGMTASMTVPIGGRIEPREIAVRGYAAAKATGGVMRVTAAVSGKIEQKDVAVRGYAAVKVTEAVQRIEVTVKGGNN